MRRPAINVRLPAKTARQLEQVAKLAGESVPTLLRVIIAFEVFKHRRARRSRR